MSVADHTMKAFSRRQERNAEILMELETKRQATEMLQRAVCGCGLPKTKPTDVVCPVCWWALPISVRRNVYSPAYYDRVAGCRAARKFAIDRNPNPQPMGQCGPHHRHD